MPSVRRDWLDNMQGLTVAGPDWPADAVAGATRQAARLAALARTLVDGGIVPAACGYPDRCRLAEALPGACDVARALAETRTARSLPPTTPGDAEAATAAFLDALAAAGSTIYVCRRVLHPTGECLFGGSVRDAAGVRREADLCGRVLLTAHRLGGADTRGA